MRKMCVLLFLSMIDLYSLNDARFALIDTVFVEC